jgi:hypothetical protein
MVPTHHYQPQPGPNIFGKNKKSLRKRVSLRLAAALQGFWVENQGHNPFVALGNLPKSVLTPYILYFNVLYNTIYCKYSLIR